MTCLQPFELGIQGKPAQPGREASNDHRAASLAEAQPTNAPECNCAARDVLHEIRCAIYDAPVPQPTSEGLLLAEAAEIIDRALVAEDPDEWTADGLAVMEKLRSWAIGEAKADARAEIAKLKAVVNAAAALVDQWEAQHNCPDCEAKAEAMGGRCDPTCDICLERWAVAHDAYDDARSSREGVKP